jgi:hypothetical protein
MPSPKGFTIRERGRAAFAALFLNGKELVSNMLFTIVAGAANITTVKIQAANKDGNPIAGVFNLTVFLSDAATGIGLTAVTASGTVQAKAASGTDVGVITAKKALDVTTLADGSYTLEITDSAKTLFYIGSTIPSTGQIVVSRKLTTPDFG